jgi:hypothetical protein
LDFSETLAHRLFLLYHTSTLLVIFSIIPYSPAERKGGSQAGDWKEAKDGMLTAGEQVGRERQMLNNVCDVIA